MHLILTGATGLVGGGVLDAMLAMPEITRISVLTRRPVPQLEARIRAGDARAADADRVRVVLHDDFARYDDSLLQGPLRGAAGVVWALGVSQLAVSKEDYVTITKDYTLAAAEAFRRIPAEGDAGADAGAETPPFRFVYVSGEGAALRPGWTTQRFGRVKGETERALGALAASRKDSLRPLQAVSVRPAGVDPTDHAALLPFVPPPSAAMRLMRATLLPPLRAVWPGMVSPTRPLGTFLAQVALGAHDARLRTNAPPVPGLETLRDADHQLTVLPNVAFRRIMGLDGKTG